jgi:uncharacterized protein YpiB (UPF0302 family)
MTKDQLAKQIADSLKRNDAKLMADITKQLRNVPVNATRSFSGR